MEKEFFKAIGLYIDSQYIKVYTKYWVYERGRCSTVPAFILRRDCSDEELLKHIKICFENSKYISEKEYDNLGGWDILWNILKKALKKKSLKNFYQTSVGFCLEWSGEMAVHISVWKYYVGKAASQTTADETFDLEYDEASPAKFVVRLRQIMEEMYEKYHVKSNDEIRQAKKQPGQREINKALSELDKKDTSIRKNVSKKFGWKQSSYINWKAIQNDGQRFCFTNAAGKTSFINVTAIADYKGYYPGLSGFIVGKLTIPEVGEDFVRVVCYDLACSNCYQTNNITKPLSLQTGGFAKCHSCGRTYNLNDGGNVTAAGPGGRPLYRYRVNYISYALIINNG